MAFQSVKVNAAVLNFDTQYLFTPSQKYSTVLCCN